MKKILFLALLCATIPFTACDDNDELDPGKQDKLVAVKGVAISENMVSVIAGATKELTVIITPENATKKTVTWISDNPSVATVNSDGVVTAIKFGEAVVTATSDDNLEIKATCLVSVGKTPVTGVMLNKATTEIEVGKTETLIATIAPEDATDKTVEWSSSATAIASVSTAGVVTAKTGGTAVITVKTKDGAKTATCAVTVQDAPTVLDPEKTAVTLAAAGGPIKVNVTANKVFTAVSDQAWLTTTVTADAVTLTPKSNLGQPDRSATVTLSSEGLTATIAVNQKQAVYADFLGTWTLTGQNSVPNAEGPATFTLTITQKTAGVDYTIKGFSKSTLSDDFPLTGIYAEEGGLFGILSSSNMGTTQDAQLGACTVRFNGVIQREGQYSYVGGTYPTYLGAPLSDGSLPMMNGSVTLQGGGDYDLIGACYGITQVSTGKGYAYVGDEVWLTGVKLVKSSTNAPSNIQMLSREIYMPVSVTGTVMAE